MAAWCVGSVGWLVNVAFLVVSGGWMFVVGDRL